MPLRDHFRPPISELASWQGFHALWPGAIVFRMAKQLPAGYVAEPRVQLGTFFEIDVGTFDRGAAFESEPAPVEGVMDRGSAQHWESPAPTLTIEAEFPDQYAYEVLVFHGGRARRLVAAIEFVSPANKDRPDNRQLFVAKCAGLLQKGVSLSIIDLVTVRRFNLYLELLAMRGHSDPAFQPDPSPTYAVTCRKRNGGQKSLIDSWAFPLTVGESLPKLPIWLTESDCIWLDLNASYEETCDALGIA